MRSVLSAVLLAAIVAPAVTHAQYAADPYTDAVQYVREAGIAEGYSDGSFGAANRINRAEMLTILMRATGAEGGGLHCFRDVRTEWFAHDVCGAYSHGMVSGYPDGTFRPSAPVTFGEAASMTSRAYGEHPLPQPGEPWYMPYYAQLMQWDAVPPTMTAMNAPITRGEMAYIIQQAERAHDAPQPYPDPLPEPQPRDEDISVEIDVPDDTLAPGMTFTVTITLENDGDDGAETDVTVTLDDGLEVTDAEDADTERTDLVRWERVEVDGDDEEELTFTARVERTARSGDRIDILVETDDDEGRVEVRVGEERFETALGDPVLHWNTFVMEANAVDHTGTYGAPEQAGPCLSSRAMALTHAAIYEAVNAIDGGYQPLIARIPVQEGVDVSVDAAVAVAAHRTLVELYAKQRQAFDAALSRHLALIPEGSAKTLGMVIGETAATQVMAGRISDGSYVDFVHIPSTLAGKHRADPINPSQPYMGAKCGAVKPMVIRSGQQFRAAPPPALGSPEYAAAFNEIKQYGGDGITTPTIRTQDQTQIGLFWAYDGVKKIGTPPRLFNQITRVIAAQKGNTIMENARLFALINIAQMDGGIAAWESKYFYDVWRPIIGVREADGVPGHNGHTGDGNPLTQGDTAWTPLGAPMSNMTANNFTPPFPAYPSGHATFGTAIFRIIERFYGTEDIAFTVVSDELNGVTRDNAGALRPYAPRSYRRLSEAVEENLQSRVYLGVHWQFDQQAGKKMGREVADYVFDNAMEPVR